ncbi:MAG: hypothetical protein IKU21_04320 [Anaerotignum sp.]|nr:hypothetical protein [Anaerotignum sp.]
MKKSSVFITAFSCFLLYSLLRYPSEMLSASADSIRLWLTCVFPSLFPFLAASGILLRTGAAEKSGKYLSPFMKPVFGLNGIAAFPFFLGMLSGYPMGAKITAELYEQKQITLEEAQHILVFCNNPGPLFLIGTIGAGFFGMPQYGYLLLFSSVFGSVLTGILWKVYKKTSSPETNSKSLLKISQPLGHTLS